MVIGKSVRPRFLPWHIDTPHQISKGETGFHDRPIRIQNIFFGWHNAMTTLKNGLQIKLYCLFNIRNIIEQNKW